MVQRLHEGAPSLNSHFIFNLRHRAHAPEIFRGAAGVGEVEMAEPEDEVRGFTSVSFMAAHPVEEVTGDGILIGRACEVC